MRKLQSQGISLLITMLVWVLLTGTLQTPSLIAGFIVSLLVMAASAHLFTDYTAKWLEPKRYFYYFKYIVVFVMECFKANIDVAWRVIQPDMPINPGIVKVKTKLKSEAALTFLANTITLTPGTFTIDIDGEEGVLYIHWIYIKEEDMLKATEIIVKKFEDTIARILE
jgi:multicomponent Na+:H+ antiporter subunit E